ncbi:MAG: hypothetical protein J5830_06185 [Clostridia bacterium]|nr:hypothetical protein [Clostridia bacterium]
MIIRPRRGKAFCLPEKWTLSFDGDFEITDGDGNVFASAFFGDGVAVSARFPYTSPFGGLRHVDYLTLSSERKGKMSLCFGGARLALYAGDELRDEEWPVGKPPSRLFLKNGSVGIISGCELDEEHVKNGDDRIFSDVSSFRPEGTDSSCGDCMPFNDPRDGRYRLFFLYDRRHHGSKYGLGAHQWAQISTSDGVTWQTEPMAIGITKQWEGSICTGSVIEHDGIYYAYYAVRMCDGTPAKLTCARSTDCRHFEKSGRYFSLTAPYESVSARDPKLFRTDDGIFHMLVTTSVGETGALAHLVSTDLETWEQKEPFILAGRDVDQPECSDWFRIGNIYYLVFSLGGTARYRFSDNPTGPWTEPEDGGVIVDRTFRVPKAALLCGKTVFSGFVVDPGYGYGGHIELYEAKQHPDGTLGFSRYEK